jgi:S1-C subfamily serine protease
MVVAIGAYQLANLDEMLDRRNSEPVPRRRLGASVSDGRVRSLRTESVAGKAGLKTGDVIVAVDGKSVDGRRELGRALQEGGPIKTLTVERDGARIDLKLDWSKDPDEAKRSARRRTHEGQGAK